MRFFCFFVFDRYIFENIIFFGLDFDANKRIVARGGEGDVSFSGVAWDI
jgi:hypothetical protein